MGFRLQITTGGELILSSVSQDGTPDPLYLFQLYVPESMIWDAIDTNPASYMADIMMFDFSARLLRHRPSFFCARISRSVFLALQSSVMDSIEADPTYLRLLSSDIAVGESYPSTYH